MFRAIVHQALAVVALAMGCLATQRWEVAVSAFIGGACIVLPNLLFAIRLSANRGRSSDSYPTVFFVGELVKLLATTGLMAIAAVVIGVVSAVMKYRGELAPVAPANVSIWTRFVRRDLLQDDANEFLFMRPGQALTSALVAVDEKVIDGAVRGVGSSVLGSATGLRKIQTGYVRNYALLILVGALIILGSIWVVTH